MTRYRSFSAVVVALVAASGFLPGGAAQGASAPNNRINVDARPAAGVAPASGALFGAALADVGGTLGTAMQDVQSQLGRRLDLERIYDQWNTPQPSPVVKWVAANGYLPVVNIAARTTSGQSISWSNIASGLYDSTIRAQAAGLRSLGVPVLLSFDREPDQDRGNSGASSYIAAAQHYENVFRSAGATNVSFAFITEALAFTQGIAANYYPGDTYVDWIGVDGYNTFGCTGASRYSWESFSQIFSGFYEFGTAHNKPLILAEWASTEDASHPGRKAQWIDDAATTIKSWPAIKAESYFDAPGSHGSACHYPITSSSSAQAAMVAMAGDAYFNPKPQASVSASPGTGTAPLNVTLQNGGTVSPASPITSWSIDFGDGTSPMTGTGNPPTNAGHTYPAGTFTATLTVSAADGLSDFAITPVKATTAKAAR